MAKQSGLGARLLLGGYDISGNMNSVDQISGGPALIDSTDITQSAHSRLPGLRDGHVGFTSFMDAALAHVILKTLPTADTQAMVLLPTLAVGGAAAALNAKQVGYDPTRDAAGDLKLKVQCEGNAYGLEWGVTLTAGVRTDTSATNGTSLDNAASTAFGAQAYFQCTAFTGTDVTVKVQDSADNTSFADVTGLTFTQVTTANVFQRLATSNSATIRRYLRAVTVTTGGFTSATFAVAINRNPIAGVVFVPRVYSLLMPPDVTVKAACEDVGCEFWRDGWDSAIDERTAEGQAWARLIRQESGRTFRELKRADGVTVFRFDPGQRCFQEHRTRPGRYLVRGVREHSNLGDWIEDIGEHVTTIEDLKKRG